jgi:hypothetical protein
VAPAPAYYPAPPPAYYGGYAPVYQQPVRVYSYPQPYAYPAYGYPAYAYPQ